MKVRCFDVQGNAVLVPKAQITFRPAVYGLLLEADEILLSRHAESGLLLPPGKMLDTQETPTDSIRHYFHELTGFWPALGPLLFVEDSYQYDSQQQSWHLSQLYYALQKTTAVSPTPELQQEQANQPEWIKLATLTRSQMQFGYEAIKAALLHQQL